MKTIALVPAVLAAAVLLIAAPASAKPGNGNTGFGFNATDISGFPNGAARLTGGGAFNLGTPVSSSPLAASGAPRTSARAH
jgi:hypothetical protein